MGKEKEIVIVKSSFIIELIKLHDTATELQTFWKEVSTIFNRDKKGTYSNFEKQVVYRAFETRLQEIIKLRIDERKEI